jgi:hypothetical protein
MSVLDEFPRFLDLGAWTKEHILPLFLAFKEENFAPALALVIFASALALCAAFVLYSTYIRIQISRRTYAVRRIKDKPGFAKAMPEIEGLMSKSRYLRHSWEKFRETLIEPLPDEPAIQVIRNTVRPQSYFNMSEEGLGFALFRAMPNLLVGIGLLLTFFGLVSALYFATVAIQNANPGDLAASQDALRNLLYAASFKFYTSIAGLAGSIILTLALRYGTSKIESRFDDLAFALERKIVLVTSEWIAFEQACGTATTNRDRS